MHEKEVDLLSSFLRQSTAYFEFGMGGSTVLASSLVQRSIVAIDSSEQWVSSVRAAIPPRPGQVVKLHHIDIGEVGAWGTPVNPDRQRSLFPAYSKTIDDAGFYDLCLVDGRFRVSCFLQALLRAPSSDTIIGIHDYAARPAYHVIEQFARPISSALQLSFFVPRPNTDEAELAKAAEFHRFDPA